MNEKLSVQELADNKEIYEVWDEELNKWVDYDDSCYSSYVGTGFPEPEAAREEILTITLKNSNGKLYRTWGFMPFDPSKCEQKVEYYRCKDERDMLVSFLEFWTTHYPDILTGWFSEFFDIPYLVNRIDRLFGEDAVKSLSPWGIVHAKTTKMNGREQTSYHLVGITQLDYLDLFRKFTVNTLGQQESYKLDHIAHVVLGEKKLDYSEYGSLHTLYKENYQKYVEYNVKDVELVDRIDQELGLIDLVLTMAYRAKCKLSETLGTTNIWDAILYNEFKSRKIAVPLENNSSYRNIEGGHVKDPQIGMHKWVLSFDLNSLYPNLIIQYNMSPETFVRENVSGVSIDRILNGHEFEIPKNRCITGTGQLFRNDIPGIIPEIIENFYEERVVIKGKMLDAKREKEKGANVDQEISILNNNQMAIKILMNSFYGALANQYFRYFNVEIAEAITISGQLTIRTAEKVLNEYLNNTLKTDRDYVVAIDTDSVYLNLSPLVNKVFEDDSDIEKVVNFLDKVAVKIEKVLDEAFTNLQEYMRAPTQKMVMGREIIADKAIWTAKKRYIANVHDSEGVRFAEPKLKVTGIEAVRSSTPAACKQMILDTLTKIMTSSEAEVQDFIQEKKKEFFSLNVEDIAAPRSANNIENYMDAKSVYRGSTPIHVRAALLYNKLLKEKDLDNKYETIQSGNKMKFVFLKKPNILQENVVGFANVLPKEFELQEYIDYETQFEKTYIASIKIILDAIGWNVEKVNSLEDFFS